MRKILYFLLLFMLTTIGNTLFANDGSKEYLPITKKAEANMSQREKAAKEKLEKLFKGAKIPEGISESEIYDITNKFIYGDVYQNGKLTDKEREMITLAVLATIGTNKVLKMHVYSALNAGMTPVEITETIYHVTPYIGSARVLESILEVNEVFKEKGIAIPESQSTVTEDTRWDMGKDAQTKIFGDLGATKPKEGEIRVGASYLPDYCFGDFYTRTGLTLDQHELLTLVCIASLGGCDGQLAGHIRGNKNMGRSKDELIEVITVCLPYIGYPRTLNAIAGINKAFE